MRRRNEIQQEETRHVEDLPEKYHETRSNINNNDTNNNGVVDKQVDKRMTEDDKELERFFQIQNGSLDHCSVLQLEPREKFPKVKLTKETEGSANRVLDR